VLPIFPSPRNAILIRISLVLNYFGLTEARSGLQKNGRW
jgi:hypothetical protein